MAEGSYDPTGFPSTIAFNSPTPHHAIGEHPALTQDGTVVGTPL